MRRIPAAIAVIGLSALALVGCSSGGSAAASCAPSAASSPALDLINASGAQGSPSATLTDPVYVDATAVETVTAGEGRRITSEAQDVVFSVAIADGTTGQTLVSSSVPVQPLSSWEDHYAGLVKMMMCATEGSRLVGAIPASDLSADAAANFGLAEDASVAVVLDVQQVYLAAADGAPQFNDRRGMPSVVLAPDGRPGIIVPDAQAPDDLVVEVLKKGDGPAVGGDDSIRVHYTGLTWADREVFDSTWEKGASVALTLDGVVDGFAQALDGQTVGSQLLVVIPPSLGYGDEATGSIPAGSTLVFVIDILGVDAPAATQ